LVKKLEILADKLDAGTSNGGAKSDAFKSGGDEAPDEETATTAPTKKIKVAKIRGIATFDLKLYFH
jgi:hypothetical protein